MNAISKALATAAVVLAGPIFAIAASAAEMPPATKLAASTSLTGAIHSGPMGLLPAVSKQNTIKVAGRFRRRGWRRRRWRGPGLAAGIVAGVATAAILSHSYGHRDRYRRSGYGRRCNRLHYRCHELGIRRACRRFYRRCD